MRIIKYGTKKLKMQRFTCPCCRLQVMQAEEE